MLLGVDSECIRLRTHVKNDCSFLWATLTPMHYHESQIRIFMIIPNYLTGVMWQQWVCNINISLKGDYLVGRKQVRCRSLEINIFYHMEIISIYVAFISGRWGNVSISEVKTSISALLRLWTEKLVWCEHLIMLFKLTPILNLPFLPTQKKKIYDQCCQFFKPRNLQKLENY